MGKEFLLDDDPTRTEWVSPDEKGFTLRTEFKDTQAILDENARLRAEAPVRFGPDGERLHLVCRVPMEVIEQYYLANGFWPNAEQLIQLAQQRDYSKLMARDVKL